jgi:hypothetical protein
LPNPMTGILVGTRAGRNIGETFHHYTLVLYCTDVM